MEGSTSLALPWGYGNAAPLRGELPRPPLCKCLLVTTQPQESLSGCCARSTPLIFNHASTCLVPVLACAVCTWWRLVPHMSGASKAPTLQTEELRVALHTKWRDSVVHCNSLNCVVCGLIYSRCPGWYLVQGNQSFHSGVRVLWGLRSKADHTSEHQGRFPQPGRCKLDTTFLAALF